MYTMRFDMRAPFGPEATSALYGTAVEMCAWAENRGCVAAVVCEHHASEDGYLPAPLLLAAAIAARTLHLSLVAAAVIIPLYDPVRLAEEVVVLDIISKGRVSYVFGLGYRPEEYEHFGIDFGRRGAIADENLSLLMRLLSGEVVEHEGRRVHVTPRPYTRGGPTMMWGGGSIAAARRAGRYGLGLLAQANVPGMREAYESSSREHDHEPGFVLLPDRDTPTVTFVADDTAAAWEELGSYLLRDARAYAEWNPDNETSAGISRARTVDELRAGSTYRICTVEQAVEEVRGGQVLTLVPLCGGLPPETAWPYLERVAHQVAPAVAGDRREAAGDP